MIYPEKTGGYYMPLIKNILKELIFIIMIIFAIRFLFNLLMYNGYSHSGFKMTDNVLNMTWQTIKRYL